LGSSTSVKMLFPTSLATVRTIVPKNVTDGGTNKKLSVFAARSIDLYLHFQNRGAPRVSCCLALIQTSLVLEAKLQVIGRDAKPCDVF